MARIKTEGAAIDSLAQKRCRLHAARQAVCRCPRCQEFFCRECVVEHESQYLCSACLTRYPAASQPKPKGRFSQTLLLILAAAALFCAWFFFYILGQWLLRAKAV